VNGVGIYRLCPESPEANNRSERTVCEMIV